MYLSALSFYPNQASIHLKYAGFLRYVRGDLENASQHYRLSYEHNPEYADGVGGYASFLHGTGGDKILAQSLYEKAIKVCSLVTLFNLKTRLTIVTSTICVISGYF
jgi:tetratricopeptide (TPR) repeat protein